MSRTEQFRVEAPYDLSLSLRVSGGFSSGLAHNTKKLRTAVRIDGNPVVMEVEQVELDPPILTVRGTSGTRAASLRPVATWILFGDFDLTPFYGHVRTHPLLGPLVERLRGLKLLRPPSLFEMAVTAVTEQQISMAAAYQIRARLVSTFGERPAGAPGADHLMAFPTPERLASASLEELQSCGLSWQKADYIRGLAAGIAASEIDLAMLHDLSNDEARTFITAWRGFGPWSADYILIRGLARADCAPVDDLGVRTVVGEYLGTGSRMAPGEVQDALAPFEPYRGLVAFYLLAASRLAGA